MTAKEKELAKAFAASIKEHEQRNDYGGTYGQAKQNFTEQVWTNRNDGSGYALPDGGMTTDIHAAVDAWATA